MSKGKYLYIEDVGFRCHVASNTDGLNRLYLFQALCKELMLSCSLSFDQLQDALNRANEQRITILKERNTNV